MRESQVVYDNWEEDKELCKLLNEVEREEAKKRDDPELNVSWKYLMTLKNWLNWLGIVKKKDPLMYDVWTDLTGCFDCKYLKKKYIWCKFQNIPATINPYLTIRTGMVGMACMGTRPRTWVQLNLFQANFRGSYQPPSGESYYET